MNDMQEPLSPPLPSLPASPSTSRPEPKPRKRRIRADDEHRKRGRYVSRACEVCKRRKLKCDGQEPCQRCVERADDCSYLVDGSPASNVADGNASTPTKVAKSAGGRTSREMKHLTNLILHMQEKIESLSARIDNPPKGGSSISEETPGNMHSLDTNTSPVSHSEPRSHLRAGAHNVSLLDASSPPLPPFSGPTSSNFSFDIAKNLLKRVQGSEESTVQDSEPDESTAMDEELAIKDNIALKTGFRESLELLQGIGEEEAVRLAQVYEDILGALHPIIDFKVLHSHIQDIFSTLEGGTDTNLVSSVGEANLNILVLILAIALLSEGEANRLLSAKLFSSVRYALDYRIHANNIDISGQILMLLAGVYHFLRDEQRLASRIVAITARMTLEAGLHRREVLFRTFSTRKDRMKAVMVLWSIFVFDRQFSYAAGLPDSMKHDVMDVPEPEGAPYLRAMTAYVELGEKAWDAVTDRHGRVTSACSKDTLDFIEYQLLQWQKSFPENLQPPPHRVGVAEGQDETRGVRCMRTLLYLRANQMRILILRPLLFSQASFAANKVGVSRVLEVARDTIRVLAQLDATSDIYRKQQVIFNHFLAAALAVLSLVLAHEPQQRQQQGDAKGNLTMFASAREEIFLALELVRSYSTFSSSSRKLWKTFGTLRELLSRLGLLKRDNQKEQQNLITEPEMEFSELFDLLGDDVPGFPVDTTLAGQGLSTSDLGVSAATSWQAATGLDFQGHDFQGQWGDLNSMAGINNVFGGAYQDFSWTFHGPL